MSLEYQIILGVVVLLIFFVALVIKMKMTITRQRDSILRLQEEKIVLKENIESETEISSPKQESETDFVKSQILKIETLQEELFRQKQRVQEAKSLAQDSSMVQYNFLSNVSHEIRTPLNSILVFAELLEQDLQESKYTKYTRNILHSGRKLLTLMDDVIELAKLETKEFKTQTKAVATKELFEMLFNEYSLIARKKGLEFTLEIDEKLPLSLILDDSKIEDILRNLIDNALKYTSHGYVKLIVVVENTDTQNNTLDMKMIVQDSGRGIESENINNIFKIFEKHQQTTTSQLQGSGIELSINKKVAKLLNGDINVTSKFGEGSLFTFELNGVEIVLYSADEEIDESSIDFSLLSPDGADIMVIDDNETSTQVIKECFSATSVKTHIFANPQKALELLKQKSMDLIFVDLDILSVDENALSKVIARMSKADVVSLTSTSIKNISFSQEGVKIVGHLKKPISKAALFQLALKELNNSQQRVMLKDGMSLGEDAFSKFDQKLLENFIKNNVTEVNQLFIKAYKTKDLKSIELFSSELLRVSLREKVTPFSSFANELLEEIKLFNIDTINSMLKEYESRVKKI